MILTMIFGQKGKFTSEGVVPVNYTKVLDIKMAEKKIATEVVYGNSQKQLLSQHLFATGYVAALMVEQLTDDQPYLIKAAFIAGCLHDLGKLDPEFRKWLEGVITKNASGEVEIREDGLHIDKVAFSFDKHPTHNEISLWLTQFIDLPSILPNRKIKEMVEHVTYWHHAKPIRKDEYKKIKDIHRKLKSVYKTKGLSDLVEHSQYMLAQIAQLNRAYLTPIENVDLTKCAVGFSEEKAENVFRLDLPEYKQYELEDDLDEYIDQISSNAKVNLLRTCVISADRQVSALSAEQLSNYIEKGTLNLLVEKALTHNSELIQGISNCLTGFESNYPDSERNRAQSDVAKQLLSVESVAVLNGPAGCGKTKLALEWAKLTKVKKIIWVCPRVQVCEGLYQDLTSLEYLPDSKIEICTGEFKYINASGEQLPTETGCEFSGDIILTTIDQIISGITTHANITSFVAFLNSHIVFDEYHEYITMPAFNMLFSELIQAKKLMGNRANTLLVSATPNFRFIERILEIDPEDVISIKSFNQSKYQIDFQSFDENLLDDNNPLFMLQPENTIVISNTATVAQQAYLKNHDSENALVFHGKFKTCDKQDIFNAVHQNFKHKGSKEFSLLRSGPIVQASLNITCEHMVTEFTLAENWLQRLGRLDRFGENSFINRYITAIPQKTVDSNGKINTNCSRFLKSTYSYRSAYAWYEFLRENLPENALTINEIYHLYAQFYRSNKGIEAVEQDILAVLKESVKVINDRVHDPVRFVKKVKPADKKKIKKSSLRGDSRFVQMAIYSVDKYGNGKVGNTYAINWQQGDIDFTNCYTESLNTLRQSGLLDYAAQKHGRIDENSPIKKIPANKMLLRKQVLEGAAVEPENPIYLSYTPADMEEKLNENISHEGAIYYVVGSRQVIGAMPLAKIPTL